MKKERSLRTPETFASENPQDSIFLSETYQLPLFHLVTIKVLLREISNMSNYLNTEKGAPSSRMLENRHFPKEQTSISNSVSHIC